MSALILLFLLALACASNEVPITLRGSSADTNIPDDLKICSNDPCDGTSYASFSDDINGKMQPFGLFSSQIDEVDRVDLNLVQGKVPEWLSGTLYRVGAGMYELGNRRVNNIIDGLSKVHRWSFTPGEKPTFTAKFLRSSIYNRTIEQGELIAMQYMGDLIPPLSFLERQQVKFSQLYRSADNNNIAVWELSKKGICVTAESPLYIDVDHTTLKFLDEYHVVPDDFRGYVEKEVLSASHFARHPISGDSINYKFIISLLQKPAYHIIRYSTNENGKLVATTIGIVPVDATDIRVIHSLGATDNYVVLPRFNLLVSTKSWTRICDNIVFDKTKSTVFDVISIKDGKHTAFKFPPSESQHVINTYERYNDKNELEIVADFPTKNDVSDYPQKCIFEVLNIDNILNDKHKYQEHWRCFSDMRIRRFILNMDTGEESIYEFPQMWNPKILQTEFPYINDNYRGQPYCFAYLHAWQYDVHNSMGLLKIDMCRETSIGWEEQNKFPVEPVFAPRPGGTLEDDGVIISPVFDSVTNTTEVFIWNATDLSVLARLDSPVVVPFTLHGLWMKK